MASLISTPVLHSVETTDAEGGFIDTISPAIGAVGTAAQIFGSLSQGRAVSRQAGINAAIETQNASAALLAAEEQARIFDENANIFLEDARAAEIRAVERERLFRREGTKFLADQRVRIAQSGVRLEGTPLLVMEETTRLIEEDALAIRDQALTEGERLRSQARIEKQRAASALTQGANAASRFHAGAMVARIQGDVARQKGVFDAGSTLLTAFG